MSLTCPLCNQNGFSLNVLIKHVNEQHLTSINSILCPICFIRQNHLAEHLYQHTEENIIIEKKAIKQIQTLNSDEKEFKSLIKSHEKSINNENEERNLFIHFLLTDLFSRKSFDKDDEIVL